MKYSVKEVIWVKYHGDISMTIRYGMELGYYYSILDRYNLFDMAVMLNNVFNLVENEVL